MIMANYMFILRPTEKTIRSVCPICVKRGEVIDNCPVCHGTAIRKRKVPQYYVQDKPIQITHIDRDAKTGILRYWENSSEFFYETVYPDLNKYVPEVPHGIHLCHDDIKSAQAECERINKYLYKKKYETAETLNVAPEDVLESAATSTSVSTAASSKAMSDTFKTLSDAFRVTTAIVNY
jgi:GTP cyclohydrolase III